MLSDQNKACNLQTGQQGLFQVIEQGLGNSFICDLFDIYTIVCSDCSEVC